MSPEIAKRRLAFERWENEGGHLAPPRLTPDDETQRDIDRFGITRVQLTVFDWGGYRYSSAKDAIAAAKRAAR